MRRLATGFLVVFPAFPYANDCLLDGNPVYSSVSGFMSQPPMKLPETLIHGNARFFPKATDVAVLQWCAARGLTLEALASKVGVPRVNLSLMLKGVDPVPATTERKLRSVIDGN
jgi:hypothetical protein